MRFFVGTLLAVVLASGCKTDCEDTAPSVHLELLLASGATAMGVDSVEVIIGAQGMRWRGDFAVRDQLADGATSIDIAIDPPPAGAFTVNVEVRGKQAGVTMLETRSTFDAAPNGCNRVMLTLGPAMIADAGGDDVLVPDAGDEDAAESPDAVDPDAGEPDAVEDVDAETPDGFDPDAVVDLDGTVDPDAELADADLDAGVVDTGVRDTGVVDTGVPDTGVMCPDPPWWDLGYAARYDLTIDAAPFEYVVELAIDNALAADVFNASRANGDDLRIVWLDNGTWVELGRELVSFDAADVHVRFKIQDPAGFGGGSGAYYLYVDNGAAGAPPDDRTAIYTFFDDFEGYTIGSDGSPAFAPGAPGEWQVEDDGGNQVYASAGAGRRTSAINGVDLPDSVVEARVRVRSMDQNRNGFAVRGTDVTSPTLDAYAVTIDRDTQVAAIRRYTNGGFPNTLDTGATTVTVGTLYDLRVVSDAAHVELFVDGTSLALYMNPMLAGGLIGLYGFANDATFDDVSIRPYINPEPTVTLGTVEARCP